MRVYLIWYKKLPEPAFGSFRELVFIYFEGPLIEIAFIICINKTAEVIFFCTSSLSKLCP